MMKETGKSPFEDIHEQVDSVSSDDLENKVRAAKIMKKDYKRRLKE